jgi:phosphoglycolate phosphatase
MIKSVIFDLDGTLLNTLDDLADADNQALAEFGLPALTAGQVRMHIGAGVMNLIKGSIDEAARIGGISSENLPQDLPDRVLAVYKRYYGAGWNRKTRPYPGIPELLEKMRAIGLKLAILSNKTDQFTKSIAEYYFAAGTFAVVAGHHESWPIKPDPSQALHICRRMDVAPGETMLVGDSGSDMETAARGGMLPAGVLWGYRSEEELRAFGAELLFSEPGSLWLYIADNLKAGDQT